MAFATAALNTMLDAEVALIDKMKVHTGDPGADGTSNSPSSAVACSFSAASGGEAALSADVDFTGLGALTACTHISLWDDTVYQGSASLTGDQAANAAGEYTVTGTTTKLSIA